NFVRGKRQNLEQALADPRVEIVRGDIRNYRQLHATMQGMDYVFHLAALWLLECLEKPAEALEVNVQGTYNVARACCEIKVKKLIFSSSASVYGNAVISPMDESHPLNNRTIYGATKIAGEQILRAMNEMHGLDYLALRYFNIYGPRQDYKGTYTSVIMKILDSLDRQEPPVIYGDGTQAYDFIYVQDVARANILAAKSALSDAAINIATGKKTSINQLVELLVELTGSELQPTFKPASQVFVTDRVASIEKAAEVLGFHARVELRDGLQKLIRWREQDKRAVLPAPVQKGALAL
ncbi:MAG: NAD-dependent epimerase/dehydratase family protein, partial [Calditrichaeota bacterium]